MVQWYWILIGMVVGFIIGTRRIVIKVRKDPGPYLSKQDKVDLDASRIYTDPC